MSPRTTTTTVATLAVLALQTAASAADVLVLSSSHDGYDAAVSASLSSHGHDPTLGPASRTFDGSFELGDYDVVLALYSYGVMPTAGQAALADFVNAGGGLVTSEWLVWYLSDSGDEQPLLDVLPVEPTIEYDSASPMTFSEVRPSETLGAGLPEVFAFAPDMLSGTRTLLEARSGATTLYQCADGVPAVVGWNVGPGRVLTFANIIGAESIADPDFARLVSNGVTWATESPRRVYVTSSGPTDYDAVAVDALADADHVVDLGPPLEEHSGAEDFSPYDVVVLLGHEWSRCDVPESTQQALTDYVATGGGLVTCEWFSWMATIFCPQLETLAALLPTGPNAEDYLSGTPDITYTRNTPDATLDDGVDAAFSFPTDSVGGVESWLSTRSGAVSYYTSSGGANGDGLIGWSFGAGRVLSFSTLFTTSPLADPDYRRLVRNGAVWATLDGTVGCPSDADGNGRTDFADILVVLSEWGPCSGCAGDVTRDGEVDFADVLAVLANWGACE